MPGEWTPEEQMKTRPIGPVRMSPDGTRVAYVVIEALMTEERSENVPQIHLARTDGTESRQLTFGDKASNDPQWSPDGRWLAFASKRTEKNNLFRIRVDGGEAEQLTDLKADVGPFAWSPDGSQLAFVMSDPKTDEDERREKAREDWRFVDEDLKYGRLYAITVEKDQEGKRQPRKLTTTDVHVGNGLSGAPFDWSPDGKSIVFMHTRKPSWDDWTTGDVSIVDVETGEARELAATDAAEDQPRYSPDGRWIALTISDDPPRWARYCRIHVVPAEGGAPRPLADTFDGLPFLVGWSADSRSVYYMEFCGTRTRLCAADLDGSPARVVAAPDALSFGYELNRTGDRIGFTMESPDRPPEAFVSAVSRFEPIQVSHANEGLPDHPIGRTEIIRWQSTDGMEIEGLLTYPVGYEPGKCVPLLLEVHGGPAGVYTEYFGAGPSLYPTATFASRGYAVLRANPRGSTGYGTEFRRANQRDWGGGDYQDIMAGVDHVIEMGVADPDRMGVMGWSYGGFMTSWIITQTDRFKAASVGAGVTNTMSFTGTSDITAFVPDYMGAQPWENLDLYRSHCALFNMKGVKTPTLIQHPEADVRVPISQGYELYNALKQQGVETRMLVLPRQPHGPTEPKMVLKVMQTNIEWFDKHLRG